MKVFSKLSHYEVPSTSNGLDNTEGIVRDIPDRTNHPADQCLPLGLPDAPAGHKTLMWMTTSGTQPQSPCTSCWRHFYRLAQPKLRTLGQCMFGLAMLFIMAGIALCIWGFVGEAIKPFQIFGPVCIGVGLFIYVIGCVLCCREYPAFEKTLQVKARQEKARRAVGVLADKDIVEWIKGEPEIFEDFRDVASNILQQPAFHSEMGNVIANNYAHNSEVELETT